MPRPANWQTASTRTSNRSPASWRRRLPPPGRMSIPFDGLALPFGRGLVLAYGPDAPALNQPLFGPPVFVHVGYRLVGSSDYLLPDEAIDDRGQHFHEQEAVDWIEMLGGAFPRADAIGMLV